MDPSNAAISSKQLFSDGCFKNITSILTNRR